MSFTQTDKNTCRETHKGTYRWTQTGSGTYTYRYMPTRTVQCRTHMHTGARCNVFSRCIEPFFYPQSLLLWVGVLHSVYLIREPARVWLPARGHTHTYTHVHTCAPTNTSSSFLSTQITQHLAHARNDKSTLSLSPASTCTDPARRPTHKTHTHTHTHTSTTHILITRSPMSIWALKDCGCWARQRPHREKEQER